MADKLADRLLDKCPNCGEQALSVVCGVVAEYAIENNVFGGQDWNVDNIDDDGEPKYVKCTACNVEYPTFTMEGGYLVGLGPPKSKAEPISPDHPFATAEKFVAWLTERVRRWMSEAWQDDEINAEAEGLDAGSLAESLLNVELVPLGILPVFTRTCLYFVGPNGAWAMATPVEQAIEGDIVWVSPLMNLRNVERDELLGIAKAERDEAAKIEALLG